ncbi:MAG: bifunctional metallophosphatase/5'-nucleotidase [Oscillospiraceae bacterium]|nr:bifunctional metallophosphatase/5'-nucleotidase [Oscillospiraceae bacterium]
MKRLLALMLVLAVMVPLFGTVSANQETKQATILFTHDLHSHLLPSVSEDGGEYGGYARLMTVINAQKALHPDAILVDGGDFSMGSLFQTAFATSAIELRMMGAMGYDATTFGNHEYDYLPSGFASMLNAAADSGDPVPAIVEANYLPPVEGDAEYTEDSAAVWAAFENYGVRDYMILERGGVYFVLFGVMGVDSDECAPNSGQILHDITETSQRVVDEATAACLETYGAEPIVIALSHTGTEGGEGEDYALAQNVSGIDLIVSGHTHTTLKEPIQVGGTWIVSCGEYGKYLGVVQMEQHADDTTFLTDYRLIPIDETVEEDPATAALVESFKADVEQDYLSNYGVSFDEVLVHNSYPFEPLKQVKATLHESTLGNLFSDAYKWAVERATGAPVDVALTAAGVLRETVPLGDVTVSDIFNAASLGVGTEGELVSIYITGADLKAALEVDGSVQPLMNSAQLYISGVHYSVNTNRMIFNKVDYARLHRPDGSLEAIEDDRLYRVVTGMYAGQMLGNVEATSFGLIQITPRNENGVPIDMARLADYVVRDENGVPVKEWYAIASYLQSMGGEMDEQYAQPDGRKLIHSSLDPLDLLKNANKFTFIALGVILLLALIAAVIVRAIVRRIRKHK